MLGEDEVTYNEVNGVVRDYMVIDWCDRDKTNSSRKILKWLGILEVTK
jgi:hypothetical protein